MSQVKSAAKEKLTEAKRSSGGKLPGERGFPEQAQFEQLSSDAAALGELRAGLTARLLCMALGDDQVLASLRVSLSTLLLRVLLIHGMILEVSTCNF